MRGDKSVTLIHYLGDEKAASDFAYRSTKKNSKTFTQTCPSYLKTCKELVKTSVANVVYTKEITVMNCEPSTTISNLRFKHLNQTQISQDALYNLHEIAYDIPGFIWKISIFSQTLCASVTCRRLWTS